MKNPFGNLRSLKKQGFDYLCCRQNDLRLSLLSNTHKGEDAVIVGMGPSLRIADLELFSKMYSFACNKIFLAFGEVTWRPDCYSVIDILVAENNEHDILATDFGKALIIHSTTTWPILQKQKNALCLSYSGSIAQWKLGERALMYPNLRRGILAYGYTVLVDQIQIAYAMGFKRVFLVGLDFSFDLGSRTGTTSASGDVLISGSESNHFHKNYRKPGETWTVPRLDEQRHAFAFCRAAFEADGRRLINASRSTKLSELETIPFSDIFP